MGLTTRAALEGVLNLCRFFRDLPHRAMVIGGLVVMVGAVSTVMLFLQGQELDRQASALAAQREYSIRVTNCQTRANEAFRDALTKRSTASAGQLDAQLIQVQRQIEQNEGQDQLLSVSADQGSLTNPEDIRVYRAKLAENTAALRAVAQKLTEVQNARTQNPYPPLKCGAP